MSVSRNKQKEITLAELHRKKTSPKTLEIQGAKTAASKAYLAHDCTTEGAFSSPERQEMKRERLHKKKPKRIERPPKATRPWPTEEEVNDFCDGILKEMELDDRRDARHKRRGTIPKFRKRLFLAHTGKLSIKK